jgi:hypothetical protein
MPWMTPKATGAGEAVEPVMIPVHGSKTHLGVRVNCTLPGMSTEKVHMVKDSGLRTGLAVYSRTASSELRCVIAFFPTWIPSNDASA